LVFAIHLIAWLEFNAYDRWPLLDLPTHLLGGVAVCYLFQQAVNNFERLPTGLIRPIVRMRIVSALTLLAALLWELVEWIVDHAFGTHHQTSTQDTITDVCLGVAGGLVYLLFQWPSSKSSS
jgi:hypothetical protein